MEMDMDMDIGIGNPDEADALRSGNFPEFDHDFDIDISNVKQDGDDIFFLDASFEFGGPRPLDNDPFLFSPNATEHMPSSPALEPRDIETSHGFDSNNTKQLSVPKRFRVSPQARQLLKERFMSIRYPDALERKALAARTGMTLGQIQTWFRNERRRSSTQETRVENDQMATGPAHLPHSSTATRSVSFAEMDSSISYHQSESASNISMPLSPSLRGDAIEHTTRSETGFKHLSSLSETMSSNGSRADAMNRRSRKGRRRHESVPRSSGASSPKLRFLCTFCDAVFDRQNSWKRHELSIHITTTEWICNMADEHDPELIAGVSETYCHYCSQELTLSCRDAHLDTHEHAKCVHQLEEDRVFYREDKLRQHFRGFHKLEDISHIMALAKRKWVKKVQPLQQHLQCSFCPQVLPSVQQRMAHVVSHFKDPHSEPPPSSSPVPGPSFLNPLLRHLVDEDLRPHTQAAEIRAPMQGIQRNELVPTHLSYGLEVISSRDEPWHGLTPQSSRQELRFSRSHIAGSDDELSGGTGSGLGILKRRNADWNMPASNQTLSQEKRERPRVRENRL